MYFRELEAHSATASKLAKLTTELSDVDTIPVRLVNEMMDMAEELKREFECPCCLEPLRKGHIKNTFCTHKYCDACYDKCKAMPKSLCALCRKPLS
jgi:hypothetical protein